MKTLFGIFQRVRVLPALLVGFTMVCAVCGSGCTEDKKPSGLAPPENPAPPPPLDSKPVSDSQGAKK
jgi:hypothetical protein